MKRTILIITLILAFILPVFAQSDYRAKLGERERVVIVRMPDGHIRAFRFTRPEFKETKMTQSPRLNDRCSYAFFGETCEVVGGLVLCTSIWWSEACQLGAICFNWYGDCGTGCTLGGECIEGIESWLLD